MKSLINKRIIEAKPRRVLMLLITIFCSYIVNAQPRAMLFDHLQNIKGLGKRSITSIIQDDIGFLWMGTQDGLLRFDGYDLKVYKSNLNDVNSLSDNNIRALAKDKNGNLWIATQGGGLNKFDQKLEKFDRYINQPSNPQSISGNAVWSVLVDSKGLVWCGTWSNGINSFDPLTNRWKQYGKGSSQDPVLAIAEDSQGAIWYGSSGLNKLDTQTGIATHQTSESNLSLGGIRAILEGENGVLWLASDLAGIVNFDPSTMQFNKFGTGISELAFHCLFKDKDSNIWMGGNSGLLVYNQATKSLSPASHNDLDPYSLSNNAVRVIMEDAQGIIWVGNEGGGVNQLLEQKAFRVFRHDNTVNSLSYNLIRSMYDDRRGVIWVGTQGGGLNKFDAVKNTFSKVDKVGKLKINSEEISSIFQDSKGIYWLGTWGNGINKIDFEKETIEFVKHDPNNENSPLDDRIQIVYEDTFGEYWVGTENGLSQFNPATNQWKSFQHKDGDSSTLISNTIQGQAFLEQKDGTLWIGTWGGLNKVSPDRSQVKYYTSSTKSKLSSDHVISLCEDKIGNLWIGTFGGGLNKLELASGNVTVYTDQEGLPNNTIFGILLDDDGNLWMSTNNGLSKFNPKTKQFRNYDASEGLQSNEFYWGAAHKNRDGSLMFGGVNGFNLFMPKDIKDNSQLPPIVLSDFQIFNKSVLVGAKSVLSQSINFTNQVTVSYDQAVLTFQFAALNFINPDKNKYSYKLENFDKEWNLVENKRTATYTNLDPGEYILKIKGSNNDNVWNEAGREIKIIVTPPFWRTWWFYILVVLILAALIFGFVKYRERTLKSEKKEMEAAFSKSLAEAKHTLELEQKAAREEQERNKDRNWLDQSIAKFAEILSVSRKDVSALSSSVLTELIKHLNVVGGAVYLFNEVDDTLLLSASYGFSKIKKSIGNGEGLAGMCFNKGESITIDSIPQGYAKISSGLGETTPRFLFIIPLKTEESKIGVLELASFSDFSEVQKNFVMLLVEKISITISITTLVQKTSDLLEQSRLNTEDLKLREEELKQNLEELQAIQEDRDRKSKQLEEEVRSLREQLKV